MKVLQTVTYYSNFFIINYMLIAISAQIDFSMSNIYIISMNKLYSPVL